MTRMTAIAVGLVMIVAACGDDDGTSSDPTSPPTTTTTTTTTAAPTTAAPTTTTSTTTEVTITVPTQPPSTTTADGGPSPELLAASGFLAGDWTGMWTNTTYGSTGPIDVGVEVNTDAGFLIATVDLGGSVFGLGDPDPEIVEIDFFVDRPWPLSSALLGEFTFDIANDGSVRLEAPDVPGDGIASMTIEGRLGATGVSGTYRIEFEGGGGADGTFEVTKA